MLFKHETAQETVSRDFSGQGAPSAEDGTALRIRIHQRLLDLLNLSLLEKTPRETLRSEIRAVVVQLLSQEKRLLSVAQTDQLRRD